MPGDRSDFSVALLKVAQVLAPARLARTDGYRFQQSAEVFGNSDRAPRQQLIQQGMPQLKLSLLLELARRQKKFNCASVTMIAKGLKTFGSWFVGVYELLQ